MSTQTNPYHPPKDPANLEAPALVFPLEFQIELDDQDVFNARGIHPFPVKPVRHIAFLLLIPLALGTFLVGGDWHLNFCQMILGLMTILWVVFDKPALPFIPTTTKFDACITPDWVKLNHGATSYVLGWSHFQSCKFMGEILLLYVLPSAAYVFPKRLFPSQAHFEQFGKFASQQIALQDSLAKETVPIPPTAVVSDSTPTWEECKSILGVRTDQWRAGMMFFVLSAVFQCLILLYWLALYRAGNSDFADPRFWMVVMGILACATVAGVLSANHRETYYQQIWEHTYSQDSVAWIDETRIYTRTASLESIVYFDRIQSCEVGPEAITLHIDESPNATVLRSSFSDQRSWDRVVEMVLNCIPTKDQSVN